MKRKEGFTLVELLLSIAILSIIVGAAYAVFTTGLDVKEKGDARLREAQSARFALSKMTEDLQSAVLVGKADTFLFDGSDGKSEDERDDDSLDFLSFSNDPHPGGTPAGDLCEIGYLVCPDEESGASILYRRVDVSPDDDTTEGGTYFALAEGIVGLNIEYYDGVIWEDSHRSDKELPERVRLTLAFGDWLNKEALARTYSAVVRLAQYLKAEEEESE